MAFGSSWSVSKSYREQVIAAAIIPTGTLQEAVFDVRPPELHESMLYLFKASHMASGRGCVLTAVYRQFRSVPAGQQFHHFAEANIPLSPAPHQQLFEAQSGDCAAEGERDGSRGRNGDSHQHTRHDGCSGAERRGLDVGRGDAR